MIRDDATQRQVEAADPQTSTWLSANAGSGKTRVLTDRVARLLLEDVSPQNILCLTYTKAAAAEMQNRLFKRLGAWAMMEDGDLRQQLQDLGVNRAIDAGQLAQARTLFARAIETPGGLKIQTIHSFCAGVLRRFPLEAKVSPQFREMEEREAEILRADVVDALLLGTNAHVVHGLLAHFTGDDLSKFTAEIAGKKDAFAGHVTAASIKTALGLSGDATREDALAIAFNGTESAIVDGIKDAFKDQSATYKKFATTLDMLDLKNPSWAALETLFGLFLYSGTNSSKSVNYPQSNHKKAVEAMAPIADEVHDWMDRTAAAQSHLWAMDAVDRTRALYDFAQAFVPAYADRKLAMGALDFDDLIRKAKALLIDPNVAQWVLFRLDGGIDHILVDEAQDTSPTQWDVIKQLTQEFASGEGAQPDRARTVFVVGDKKQSIYSFQGADPAAFDQMREHFKQAHADVGKPFNEASLDHSFRSAQAVLSVVDATFTGDRTTGMDDALSHIAFKEDMPGRVDLWPAIEKTGAHEPRAWFQPVDEPSATDHTVKMAERVAEQIKHIITHETLPVETDQTGQFGRRKITEGDFLILVQRRSELFAEIIRACKAAKLEIAGADRLRVGAELAVKDLAAVLRFLALPEDDLSLAAALRSPLFDWSEQDLFTLAHHRGKAFLWTALREADHPETLAVLDDLRKQAEFLRPYDLIERILTRHDGRRRLLARLGPEAEDGIDALLSQALAYESTGVPSLTGFLNWMDTDDLEVKRQMDSQGDRIRVMTVHGAKGLEAPIVILPDTAKRDIQVKQELLPADDVVVWKTPAKSSAPATTALRESVIAKQAEERLRLLYVAMTRAEKWLIVGAAGDVGEGDASWYNIVADGMTQRGDFDAHCGDLNIRRVAEFDWDAGPMVSVKPSAKLDPIPPQFGALIVPERPKTHAPSDLGGPKVMPGTTHDDDSETAMLRGTLIHRLLEHLPMAPAEMRQAFGVQLIGEDSAWLVADVMDLMEKDELSWIWDTGALTEVDITAEVPGLGRIHGAIDRLIVTDDKIVAVDYKSNRAVPNTASDTPLGLKRQMAAYYYALAAIYPDHQIEVAILWTHTATLMVIPEDMLHEAMIDIATP